MVKQGYKQTEVGVIPEDWEVNSIQSVVKSYRTGGNYKNSPEVTESPLIKMGNLSRGYINLHKIEYIARGVVPNPVDRLQYGDVLFNTRNTPELVGKTVVWRNELPCAYYNLNLLRFEFDSERVEPFFFNAILNTKEAIAELKNIAKGTTSVAAIYPQDLMNVKIPIPQISEQRRIEKAITDMDDLVGLLEKQIAKKKAIKQGTMQELLTGKRRLPGFSGEWGTFVFGDLFDFIPNNAFTRTQLSDSGKVKNIHYGDILTKFRAYISADSNEIPYIKKEIDLGRFAEKCYLQSGDIVIADTAEDETVGKALEVINVECPVLAGQHTLLCRPKVRFSEKFLGYYLNAACYHDQLLPFIVGTKVSSISKASVAQTRLAMPKYEEQQAISCILSDMDDDITELEKKLAKYRQIKQGMMQQLLTGKIRLKNDVEDLRQAEQANAVKTLPARTAHNRQFDDAVSIAAIVDTFYSDKYPLGRVKVQKLLYLLHRHQAASVSDFKKKAAGPYADTVRYKGGEPIAKKNKYIVSESSKQGTRYFRGENMAQALNYVERWGMQADLHWLKDNFLHASRNDLELFATVDMAMSDLAKVGISVSVESIKNLIASSKEWKAKLSKTYFSDRDIARAIKKCTELFN